MKTVESHQQTSSHNVVSSTPRQSRVLFSKNFQKKRKGVTPDSKFELFCKQFFLKLKIIRAMKEQTKKIAGRKADHPAHLCNL